MNIQKNILLIVSLLIASILSSFYISRDYQTGLVIVFWICVIAGMAAYLLRNMTNREKLFYLFIFMIPLMNILNFSFKYILPLAGVLLILIVELMIDKRIKVINILKTGNGRLLVIYVVTNFILLPFSVDKKTSMTYLFSFPFIILLWDWIIQHFDNSDRIESVIKVFNFIGVFYSLLGITILILNYFGITLSIHLSYTKVHMFDISSVFPNTNTHGLLLAFTLPCAFYLLLVSRNKIFYFLCCMIMGVNLLLTYSRSSMGAAFIAVSIILLFRFKDEKIVKIAVSLVLIVAVFVLLDYASDFIISLKNNPQRLTTGIFSLSGRGLLWNAAYKAIIDRPITGFGIGNSVAALEMYSMNILGRTPHNTFLRMWVEMGIFGLLVYLIFIYNIIRNFLKARNKTMLFVALFAIIIGALFQQMFETMLLGGLSMIGGYFFIISALFESHVLIKKESGDEHDENMLLG